MRPLLLLQLQMEDRVINKLKEKLSSHPMLKVFFKFNSLQNIPGASQQNTVAADGDLFQTVKYNSRKT